MGLPLDERVVLIITSVSLILLTVAIMYIIPVYVPSDQQDEISHLTMVSFSLFMMLFSMAQVEITTRSIINFMIFVALIVIQFTGIYVWIPKYIPQDKQLVTIHWMFIISTFIVVMTNAITTTTFGVGTYAIQAAWDDISRGNQSQIVGARRK